MVPVRRFHEQPNPRKCAPLRERLGRFLVMPGIITDNQRAEALAIQKKEGGLLGQILTSRGYCSREDIASALAQQNCITTVTLEHTRMDKQALVLITRDGCLENRIFAFESFTNLICVAMANPRDRGTVLTIKNATGTPVKAFHAPWDEIESAISTHYPQA